MQTEHLLLKNGARITAIKAVAHETYRGVASWHFIGDVVWDHNNLAQSDIEIAPYSICYDRGNFLANEEGRIVFDAMNEHLKNHGRWHEAKHMKDGRVVHWTPKKKSGRSEITTAPVAKAA